MNLSIVICTHNPREDYLAATLASIAAQVPATGGKAIELILIDNASTAPLEGRIDLSWHPDARIVREERLGLTHARLRSFREARGEVILFVDDDNVLCPEYQNAVIAAFDADPSLGAAGGKSIPRYETAPPEWFASTGIDLACRNLGDEPLSASWQFTEPGSRSYPACAPIGAGMAIRRSAYAEYVEEAAGSAIRLALGRKGADLASGEDNDMILTLLGKGWRIAYLPQLSLEHLIPAGRLSRDYLERYAASSNRTWVQVLALHEICPWRPVSRWSLPFRKARAWLRLQPWRGPVQAIAWHGAVGHFEGRASIRAIGAGTSR